MGTEKILIVEDEAVAAFALELELQSVGFNHITTVASGEKALECITAERPDLIFMDIQLEGKLTGVDVVKQLHQYQKIPIIYMTASQDNRIKKQVQSTDYVGILEKPFLTAEVIRLVHEALP